MLNTVWFAAFAVCWVKGAAKRLALWQYTKINVAAIVDSMLTQCMAIVGFSLVIQHTHTAIWIETRRINRVVLMHIWKMSTRLAQSKQMPRRFPLFHACSSNNVYHFFSLFSFCTHETLCSVETIIRNERIAHTTDSKRNQTNDIKRR